MTADLTPLEPDGLQLHIRLNALLAKLGFNITPEFDVAVEIIIRDYLPYDEEGT
jgi:hypothetical protein